MTDHTNDRVDQALDARVGRRDALRIGGITLSLSAIIAACGDQRTGDSSPGRVGNAPPATPLPDGEVNDVVLLRTASSLENTIVAVYERAVAAGAFDGSTATLADRLIENHAATAAQMGELTAANGGTPWTDVNPWIWERTIDPILTTIDDSDDQVRDYISLAITLENLGSSTHQALTPLMGSSDLRHAVADAAVQEARHSAALTLDVFGVANRFTPALVGEEVTRTADGAVRQFAINSTFGSVAQVDVIVGAPDQNGARTTYTLATPAANSFIYEELSEA